MPTVSANFFAVCRIGSSVPFDPPKIDGTVDDADNANRVIDDCVEGEPSLDHEHASGLGDIGATWPHLGVVRQSRYAGFYALGNRIGHDHPALVGNPGPYLQHIVTGAAGINDRLAMDQGLPARLLRPSALIAFKSSGR